MALKLGELEVEIGADTSGLKKAEKEVQKTSKSMEQGFGRVGDAIKAAITIEAARRILMIADNMVRLEGTIRRLTRATGDFEKVWGRLAAISNENGAAIADTTALFQRFQAALKGVAENNDEVINFIDTMQKLGRVGGSSAQELSNALVQLSQGFSDGIIRAEEWNSIIAQAPEILKSAAANIEGIDGNLGKLRRAMLADKLTSETLFKAIQRGAKDANEEFEQLPTTIEMASQKLSNNFSLAIANLDKQIGASQNLAKFIDFLAEGFSPETGTDLLNLEQQQTLLANYDKQIEETTKKIERLEKQSSDTSRVIRRGAGDYIKASDGAKLEEGSVKLLRKELERLTNAREELSKKQPKKADAVEDPKVELGLGTPIDEKELEKQKKLRERQEDDAQETLDRIFLMNKSEKEKLLFLETQALAEIQDLQLEGLISFEDAQKAQEEIGRHFAQRRVSLEEEVVDKMAAAYDRLATTISDNLANALVGTESWADSMKAILADVASQFIKAGIMSAFGNSVGGDNIFSGLFTGGGRSMGGNTSGQLAHPINEQGIPEVLNQAGKQYLLPTGQGGNITPLSQAGGAAPNISMVNMGTPMNIEGVQVTEDGIEVMINDALDRYDRALTTELGRANSRKASSLKSTFNLTTNTGRR